jgi:Ni,Fe-hydrogenase III large subunit/Ni,Fe-hydrogenase III component G
MPLDRWLHGAGPMPGAPGLSTLAVEPADWHDTAQDAAESGGRLLALWGTRSDAGPHTVRMIVLVPKGAVAVETTVAEPARAFAGIEDVFPAASRMQRAMRDLLGIETTDPDVRPWLRHAAWGTGTYPLAMRDLPPPPSQPLDDYRFVRVEGDGVHEIAVGPVHAGIIEPGHFRFSVVGEKVLRLEERLGYVHKGIERRFTELSIREGHRLAARVSGDSAVAFAWAYCQAYEGLTGTRIPARAAWLRALALELERAANHLGDLGALGNDAGFAFGLSQFMRLKEGLLRATERALGQRYLNEFVVPGGVRSDLSTDGAATLDECAASLVLDVYRLRDIYDEHSGVRDRFVGAGTVTPQLAARLGLVGLAGRASGQSFDLRADLPCEPYAALAPLRCGATDGDVLARVALRFDELLESLRLVRVIVAQLPAGEIVAAPLPEATAGSIGVGLIEGWRGPVAVALEAGPADTVRRCHPHDSSWNNWPVLEHAIIGNIVPDFPLINKSFNLSYSGHDL